MNGHQLRVEMLNQVQIQVQTLIYHDAPKNFHQVMFVHQTE